MGARGTWTKGLTLVELLVALGLGAVLMGAALVGLQRVSKGAAVEQRLALSQNRAYVSVTGLEKELKGTPVAAVLSGAGSDFLPLVSVLNQGAPVLSEGYGPSGFSVLGSASFSPGDVVLLVNGAGQAYLGGVASTEASGGRTQVSLVCQNPVRWTEGTRAYKAQVVTLDARGGGLRVSLGSAEFAPVEGVRSFAVSYVYASPTSSEEVSAEFRGMRSGERRLVAVGLSASGDEEGTRRLTARVQVSPLHVPVEEVLPCGGEDPPPGKAQVTVVVDPAPPGGGDVLLEGGGGYARSFRTTSSFDDVPEGSFRVTARPVTVDGIAEWVPTPAEVQGEAYTFLPATVRVGYALLSGNLVLSSRGPLPSDASVTVSAGSYSATLSGASSVTFEAAPGRYPVDASREAAVVRSQGEVSWREVYALTALSPQEATVSSRKTAEVVAAYDGPLPGTLCYDDDCQEVPPGVYYAPPETEVGRRQVTRTEACPAGYRGEVKVTEEWRTVRYWTPSAVGVSSRETSRFTSATRDEKVREVSRDTSGCVQEEESMDVGSIEFYFDVRNAPPGAYTSNPAFAPGKKLLARYVPRDGKLYRSSPSSNVWYAKTDSGGVDFQCTIMEGYFNENNALKLYRIVTWCAPTGNPEYEFVHPHNWNSSSPVTLPGAILVVEDQTRSQYLQYFPAHTGTLYETTASSDGRLFFQTTEVFEYGANHEVLVRFRMPVPDGGGLDTEVRGTIAIGYNTTSFNLTYYVRSGYPGYYNRTTLFFAENTVRDCTVYYRLPYLEASGPDYRDLRLGGRQIVRLPCVSTSNPIRLSVPIGGAGEKFAQEGSRIHYTDELPGTYHGPYGPPGWYRFASPPSSYALTRDAYQEVVFRPQCVSTPTGNLSDCPPP